MNDLILLKILQSIEKTESLVGRGGLAKLLRGENSKRLAKYGLDHIPEFGSLLHLSKKELLEHVDYLIERGCLEVNSLFFPMIKITDIGRNRLNRVAQEIKSEIRVEEPKPEIDKIHVCNENGFWELFEQDLNSSQSQVIIMSPFVSEERVNKILENLKILLNRGVNIIVYTRPEMEQGGGLSIY